jgi:micrococcal nuclease
MKADQIRSFHANGLAPRRCALDGGDGPELKERDGRAARDWLDGKTTYDRHVGTCYDRKEQDIGAVIIANGWARDCPRYSEGRYAGLNTDRGRSPPLKGYCKRR